MPTLPLCSTQAICTPEAAAASAVVVLSALIAELHQLLSAAVSELGCEAGLCWGFQNVLGLPTGAVYASLDTHSDDQDAPHACSRHQSGTQHWHAGCSALSVSELCSCTLQPSTGAYKLGNSLLARKGAILICAAGWSDLVVHASVQDMEAI